MKKILGTGVLLVTAILSGYLLLEFLKKAGFQNAFDFDLFEDIDQEDI
jgi:hypothetical protein